MGRRETRLVEPRGETEEETRGSLGLLLAVVRRQALRCRRPYSALVSHRKEAWYSELGLVWLLLAAGCLVVVDKFVNLTTTMRMNAKNNEAFEAIPTSEQQLTAVTPRWWEIRLPSLPLFHPSCPSVAQKVTVGIPNFSVRSARAS